MSVTSLQLKQERNVSANKTAKRNFYTRNSRHTVPPCYNYRFNTTRTKGKSTRKRRTVFYWYNSINLESAGKIYTSVSAKKSASLRCSDLIGFSCPGLVWRFSDGVPRYSRWSCANMARRRGVWRRMILGKVLPPVRKEKPVTRSSSL